MSVAAAPADDALVAALRDRLAREPDVLVAYLFGSRARGTASPRSDVDVAVLLAGDPGLDRELALIAEAAEVVGSDQIDLVVLNRAPVALGYRVLRDGILLTCRDERARIDHRVHTVDRYLDTAPLRRTLADGLRHRLEEGRFGRS